MLGKIAKVPGVIFSEKSEIGNMTLSRFFSYNGNIFRIAFSKQSRNFFLLSNSDELLNDINGTKFVKHEVLEKLVEVVDEEKYPPTNGRFRIKKDTSPNVGKMLNKTVYTESVNTSKGKFLLVFSYLNIEDSTSFVTVGKKPYFDK